MNAPERLPRRLAVLTRVALVGVLATADATPPGGALDSHALRALLPNASSMKVNTAIALAA